MRKNNIYVYITAALALLVPVPGRFAYGIVLMLALNLLMLTGTLFKKCISVLDLDDMQPLLIAVMLVTVSIIFKQLLICFSPVMALVIGYAIYMPAVSSFLIGYLYGKSTVPLRTELAYNMKQSLIFSLLSLIVFLFRDIFGYGTVSLPAAPAPVQVAVPLFAKGAGIGVFWASIPGALVITALCVVAVAFLTAKFEQVAGTRAQEPAPSSVPIDELNPAELAGQPGTAPAPEGGSYAQ